MCYHLPTVTTYANANAYRTGEFVAAVYGGGNAGGGVGYNDNNYSNNNRGSYFIQSEPQVAGLARRRKPKMKMRSEQDALEHGDGEFENAGLY